MKLFCREGKNAVLLTAHYFTTSKHRVPYDCTKLGLADEATATLVKGFASIHKFLVRGRTESASAHVI